MPASNRISCSTKILSLNLWTRKLFSFPKAGMVKSSWGGMEQEEGGVDVQIKMGNENGVTYVDMDAKKNLQPDMAGKEVETKGGLKTRGRLLY